VPFQAFYNAIISALHSTTHLTSLRVVAVGEQNDRLRIILDYTFPHLRNFTCELNAHKQLAVFLGRHPGLQGLAWYPFENQRLSMSFLTEIFSRLNLPELRHLAVSSFMVPAIISGIKAPNVYIFWSSSRTEHIETVIECLGDRKENPVLVLTSQCEYWDPLLIVTIAKFMDTVRELDFVDQWEVYDEDYPMDLYRAVENVLPNFKCLALLEFTFVDQDMTPRERSFDDIDMELRKAQQWETLCPTLKCCTFANGLTWLKFNNGIWFPSSEEPWVRDWIKFHSELDIKARRILKNLT